MLASTLVMSTVDESLIAPMGPSSIVTVVESSSKAVVFSGINKSIMPIQWHVRTLYAIAVAPETISSFHQLDFTMRDITITFRFLPILLIAS